MHNRERGLVITYVFTILNTIISMFLSVFILRMLGKTEDGIYHTATSFISYLTILEFGIGTVMTRNISLCKKDGTDNDVVQRNVSTVLRVAQVLSLVILLFAVAFFFSMDFIYSKSMTHDQIQHAKLMFILMSVGLIFTMLSQTLSGCSTGYEYYTMPSIVNIVQLLVRSSLIVIFLFVYRNALVLVITDLFVHFAVFLYYLFFCKKELHLKITGKYFDKGIFKYIIPYALAMFLQVIMNTANGNVDKTVISIMMNPESVAVYSVCMYICTMFSSLSCKPITLYLPQVAKNMKNGLTGKKLTESLVRPCRVLVIISGSILFGFISVGRPFIRAFYGDDFIEVWLMAIIVIFPMFISNSNAIVMNVLDIQNKRQVRSFIMTFVTVFNIIFTIFGVKYLGMIGAVIATGVCSLIGECIVMNIYYDRVLKISIMWLFGKAYKGLLPSLIIACAAGFLVSLVFSQALVSFLVGGATFVIVELGCFIMFGFEKDERQIVLSKIPKFKKG